MKVKDLHSPDDDECSPWWSCFLEIVIHIIGFIVPYMMMQCTWRVPLEFEFEQRRLDSDVCLDTETRMNCMFGIDEIESEKLHIMVINSTSVIGLAITSQLRATGFNVIEVRTALQFNTSIIDAFSLIPSNKLRAVVDLSTNNPVIGFSAYLGSCKLFKIVEEYSSDDPLAYQIKIPPVWGPSISIGRLGEQSWIDACMSDGMTSIEDNKTYAFSGEVAPKVTEVIVNAFSSYESPKRIEVSAPLVRMHDIVALLRKKGCNVSTVIPESKLTKKVTENQFETTWHFAERQRLPRNEPYVSHIVVISDNPSNVRRYQKVLQILTKMIEMVPHLPIEFLCVFCQVKSTSSFYDIFNVSDTLKRFLRVIEVPKTFYQETSDKYNVSYFPEYIFRNIGVRRAKGEYIIVGSGDVIPPIEFFEAVATRSFSPQMYIRSERKDVSYGTDILKLMLRQKSEKRQTLASVRVRRFHDLLERDACGDFQGAHRSLWWKANGYLEGKYVFHVDTLLGMDFLSFKRMLLVNMIGYDIHVVHAQISQKTERFPFFDITDLTARGRSTSQCREWERPQWGARDIDFIEY